MTIWLVISIVMLIIGAFCIWKSAVTNGYGAIGLFWMGVLIIVICLISFIVLLITWWRS